MNKSHLFNLTTLKEGAITGCRSGLDFHHDHVKALVTLTHSLKPEIDANFVWRCCGTKMGLVIGGAACFDSSAPGENSKVALGFANHFTDSTFKAGAKWNASIVKNALENQVYNFYFNHAAKDNTAGVQLTYDQTAKQWASLFGLQLNQGDHTWKFRFHNSGLLRAALQWQLHKVCKATLNTSLSLQDIPGKSVNSLPLGLTLELKY